MSLPRYRRRGGAIEAPPEARVTEAPVMDAETIDALTAETMPVDVAPVDGASVGAPPRPPRSKKAPKPPKPPKPPRGMRPPSPPRRMLQPTPRVELNQRDRYLRGVLVIASTLLIALVLSITLVGHVRHLVAQQQLSDHFREQLREAVAPVSEGDVHDVLLPDGAPVALLEIPSIGVREIVVEGTDSETTQAGPGHRRDTVLPGQVGVSVIMGRAAGYGGPFSRIQELAPGEEFTIITGQGEHTFEVIGLRYAGDPSPPRVRAGEGRVILTTARGGPFMPNGIARVDARLTSEVHPAGARLTNFVTLPSSHRELNGDTTRVWALVFALQFLVAVELVAVWAYRRVGPRRTWIVFIPLTVLAGLWVGGEIVRLLPNLM